MSIIHTVAVHNVIVSIVLLREPPPRHVKGFKHHLLYNEELTKLH